MRTTPIAGTGGMGTGDGDGDGAGGTGSGTGGAGNPTPPADPTYDVIDDFDDGNINIPPTAGRVGFWYTYNETSDGSNPPNSSPDVRPLASNPQMQDGSYAIHATGSHLTNSDDAAYGGIGVDLKNSNGDGYQSRSSSRQLGGP